MKVRRIRNHLNVYACAFAVLSLALSLFSSCGLVAYGADTTKGPTVDPLRRDEEHGSQRPNVLLIGIETLRADHVGCLGYEKDTTPTLDRLAQEGVLCTRTMSTSGWTLPSVMSVMTSLYPDVHQVHAYERRLNDGITT